MAQLILSAGAAVGRAGLGAAIGRTVAATAASYAAGLAERLIFGPRKRTLEGPRLESFSLQASNEGASVLRVFGRARVSGQIIWAANFKETLSETTETSGGKGGRLAASKTTIKEYLYSLSFAVGLCEGKIDRVARVWADGKPLDLSKHNVRIYQGTQDQTPDDLINAVEGGDAPAFRGLAYIVFENLPLKEFGNRIPQLSFEIEKSLAADDPDNLENALTALTIIPGSGEFVYATTRLTRDGGDGVTFSENVNNNDGVADFTSSLNAAMSALPNLAAASLVVSWFGDDLRAGHCSLRPGVETFDKATTPYDWSVNGVARAGAHLTSRIDGAPAYGGTPADKAVIEAIAAMKAKGLAVMLHPFILMDVPAGNALPRPEGGSGQPAYPWRGRISVGANDKTAAAGADIAAFFGTATPTDFTVSPTGVSYHGPAEFSFRRMVLHYAHLAALAGGVEAFLLGSELKGLTAARDAAGDYPAVAALKSLAADVRSILGPGVKISYGADWSEWSGHVTGDAPGEIFFHLDDLWADDNIDFIGIDYYPPLADWRDGFDHADLHAGWTSRYDRAYIRSNIEGGENYDWYYASAADRDAQLRTAITDGAYNQPWVWRAKDLRSWWANAHHHRPGGVKQTAPTPWLPGMKPFRFTEIGAPAVDKGANQPNVFVDPKSAESALPYYSNGARDDLMQRRTLEAVASYWRDPTNNPASSFDGRPMIEADRSYVYAFDARPFPYFPARADIWGDAANWSLGHWLNGRLTRAPLDLLVNALCAEGEISAVDTASLKGALAGYVVDRPMSPRQMIDPLADVFQFDMIEAAGTLRFAPRGGPVAATIAEADLAAGKDAAFSAALGQQSDLPTAVRLGYIDEGGDYLPAVAEARHPHASDIREIGVELPGVFDEGTAAARARSILADASIMRETISFALPPSFAAIEPGDAVALAAGGVARDWRIMSIADGETRKVEAVRVAPAVYDAPIATGGFKTPAIAAVFGKPAFELMNLPLLRDDDDPGAPYFACYADPWPGAIALYRNGAALSATASARSVLGRLESDLPPGVSGRWDARTLRIRLSFGAIASRSEDEVLAGANAFAVETANGWEVAQFRDAVLDIDGAWVLSGLLRGQFGTEDEAALGASSGARVVLLNAAVGQAGLPFDLRGLAFDWSAGPADDPPTAETFRTKTFMATARGLLPLSPAHLRAVETAAGDIELTWVRRTRIGGDNWEGEEVPLGEAFERYRVEIFAGGELVRTEEAAAPAFTYDAATIAGDFPGPHPALTIRVAQFSDLVGAGAWAEVVV